MTFRFLMCQPILKSTMSLAVLSAFLVAGCSGGDGPSIVPVRGTVTFQGAPLAGAHVVFHPDSGRPSMGITDEKGQYDLIYMDGIHGAVIGHHKVSISTSREPERDSENPADRKGVKEKLPAKYNTETTLEITLEPKMKAPVDFQLDA